MQYLRQSSDPTLLAVLFEDCVACLGVVIAIAGIGLSYAFHSPIPDAIGSILIGALLGFVAVWLALRNRSLILGVAIPQVEEEKMIAWLKSQPCIEHVKEVQTRVVGSDQFSLKAEIDFNGRVLAEHVMAWLEEQPVVKTGTPDQTPDQRKDFAREFAERLMQAHGAEINRIEAELRRMFPQLLYIDLEAD
jgi:zinc transporter 9